MTWLGSKHMQHLRHGARSGDYKITNRLRRGYAVIHVTDNWTNIHVKLVNIRMRQNITHTEPVWTKAPHVRIDYVDHILSFCARVSLSQTEYLRELSFHLQVRRRTEVFNVLSVVLRTLYLLNRRMSHQSQILRKVKMTATSSHSEYCSSSHSEYCSEFQSPADHLNPPHSFHLVPFSRTDISRDHHHTSVRFLFFKSQIRSLSHKDVRGWKINNIVTVCKASISQRIGFYKRLAWNRQRKSFKICVWNFKMCEVKIGMTSFSFSQC